MVTPLPYRKIGTQRVGEWYIRKTYDGWEDSQVISWTRESGDSERVLEFVNLAKWFLKQFDDYKSYQKYFNKYGTRTAGDSIEPTLAFVIEQPLLDYVFESVGSHLTITGYRKTKKE